MPNIGPLELGLVLIVALIILDPKKLPDMGRSLGKGMREFKTAISGDSRDDHDDDKAPALTAATDAELTEERRDRVAAASGPVAPRHIRRAQDGEGLEPVDHPDELRSRLIASVMALAVALGLCFWRNDLVLSIMNRPLHGKEPITLSPAEAFTTTF